MDPNSIDLSVYYYTFSTIAQTVAVGFGLILVSATVVLDKNNKVCSAYATKMYNLMSELGYSPHDVNNIERAMIAMQKEDWRGFLDSTKIICGPPGFSFTKHFQPYFGFLETQITIKEHFINSIVCTAILTALTIVLSLAGLYEIPYFAKHPTYGRCFLFGCTLLTTACIGSFVSAILYSLGKYPNWIGWLKSLKNRFECKKNSADGTKPTSQ